MRVLRTFIILLSIALPSVAAERERDPLPLKNWPVDFSPVVGTAHPNESTIQSLRVAAVSSAAGHFIAQVPCRVADPRASLVDSSSDRDPSPCDPRVYRVSASD